MPRKRRTVAHARKFEPVAEEENREPVRRGFADYFCEPEDGVRHLVLQEEIEVGELPLGLWVDDVGGGFALSLRWEGDFFEGVGRGAVPRLCEVFGRAVLFFQPDAPRRERVFVVAAERAVPRSAVEPFTRVSARGVVARHVVGVVRLAVFDELPQRFSRLPAVGGRRHGNVGFVESAVGIFHDVVGVRVAPPLVDLGVEAHAGNEFRLRVCFQKHAEGAVDVFEVGLFVGLRPDAVYFERNEINARFRRVSDCGSGNRRVGLYEHEFVVVVVDGGRERARGVAFCAELDLVFFALFDGNRVYIQVEAFELFAAAERKFKGAFAVVGRRVFELYGRGFAEAPRTSAQCFCRACRTPCRARTRLSRFPTPRSPISKSRFRPRSFPCAVGRLPAGRSGLRTPIRFPSRRSPFSKAGGSGFRRSLPRPRQCGCAAACRFPL